MSKNIPIVVLKFGGTSVSSLSSWQSICAIVALRIEQGFRVVIVHSAKSGMTNLLERLVETKDVNIVKSLKDSIFELQKELSLDSNLESDFLRLQKICKTNVFNAYDIAEILSFGELITHKVICQFMSQSFDILQLNPKEIFIGSNDDNRFQSSKVLSARCTVKLIELPSSVAIMPGFIASDNQGRTIVLGRGGSDTSASYIAVALKAERIEIWTDVHGIFSANPRLIPTARLIEKIGYEEAREIAASGGKVLHPRCILPAEQNSIPIHIYNTQDMKACGTVIKKGYESILPRVRAINVRHKITLVSMDSMSMWHQAGFMGSIFGVYEKLGLSIDIVVTAQTNVTISLDTADNIINSEILEVLEQELSFFCDVKIYKNCSAVTLVGYRLRALLGEIAPIISNFAEHRIYLTSQSSNDLNTSIVIEEDRADNLLIALHEALIVKNANQFGFGNTWEQLTQNIVKTNKIQDNWWQTKQQELCNLALTHSPCYVYDEQTIIHQIQKCKSITAIDKVFFAMKSNSNEDVIKIIHQNGIGIETVSPGEIQRVRGVIPDINSKDVLFTPNFAAIEEYQAALKSGFHVTIDNKFILEEYPDVFTNQSVFLRLDPGHGSGHHKYVRTAGEYSKFGIHESELIEVKQFCDDHSITIKGLHSHAGSGVLEHENWQRILKYLTNQIGIFTDVRIINMGGGMGVTENPYESGLDIDKLNTIVKSFKQKHPKLKFWMEPGRFLIANAGVLLAKVTQTKVKGSSGYIGLETGMNSLIRPALYGAWHNIVNLSRFNEDLEIIATVVGQICETGDILGVDRKLPKSKAGDVFLIANCGAYGFSMASQYNLRKPAQELFI